MPEVHFAGASRPVPGLWQAWEPGINPGMSLAPVGVEVSTLSRLIHTVCALILVSSGATSARAEDPAASAAAASQSDRAPRVLAGAGLGLVGGVAGFALGFGSTEYLTRGGVGDDDCGESCGLERLGWVVLGGIAGATAGVALGTYAGSEWVGGDGSLGWTCVGGLVGSVAALGLALVEKRADAPGALIAVTLVAPPLAGAALGYELSSDAERSGAADAPALDHRGVSATLGVVPIPGGAELGLSGAF